MSKSRSSHKHRSTGNQLRIIGGKWRGRKLMFPDVDGLRPSGDRVRETLFNWLNIHLPGARCLDLFAGSGALGLEALSRGADHTTLVERDHNAAQSLKHNCEILKTDATVVEADALSWLTNPCDQSFDVVFLDPPFSKPLLDPACQLLEQHQWLHSDALIYVETASNTVPVVPASWQLQKEKLTGQVAYRLYQHCP